MTSATLNLSLHEILNLERYPIQDLKNVRTQSLITRYREELRENGYCLLDNFLLPDALKIAREEVESLSEFAHDSVQYTNPYKSSDNPALPPEHPIRNFQERSSAFISQNRLKANSLFFKIYDQDFLIPFLAQCFVERPVFRFDDPLAGIILSVMKPGTQLPWHFDEHDLNMVMMISATNRGSIFEISPNTRTADDEKYSEVARILNGERDTVKQLSASSGDLYLFNGKKSLHRVTRNTGNRDRYIVSFAYTVKKKYRGNPEANKIIYGLAE